MAIPDIGQAAARRLYASAVAEGGDAFELAEDVATRLAVACDALVDDLNRARAGGQLITTLPGTSGFPDLPTGRALARGFGGKADEYLDTLTALQETALLYKAAYLAAGKKFSEADAANRAAVALVAAQLAGPPPDVSDEGDAHG